MEVYLPVLDVVRIAIVLDNFSAHLTMKKDARVENRACRERCRARRTCGSYASRLNRIEAQSRG